MRALVNTLAFLELSEDDVVDPDSAVKVLEHAAHLLGELDASDKDALRSFVAHEAAGEPDGPRRDFLLDFPEAFGL